MARHALFERVDLDLYLALAGSGSLARAAQATGVHHATAFRRLGDLEAKVGALLFERLPGGYAPTPAGRALLAPARRLKTEMQEFDARVLNYDRALSGPVRVTTSDGLAAGYLPRHLAAFRERFPDVEIELVTENRMLDLTAREVDVAVRPARRLTGSMVGRSVGRMAYTLYGSSEYLERHDAIDPGAPDLAAHTVVGYHDSLAFFSTAKWLARHARRARVAARCNNLWTMLALARAGVGLAALPCVMGDADARVRRALPPPEAMTTQLWLLTHPSIRKVARVRALLDFLFESIGADGARLAGEAVRGPRARALR
jgi:DNA-binding transcriptional LysR family regulator